MSDSRRISTFSDARGEIRSLTALRFFAAMTVVIYHYLQLGHPEYHGPLAEFARTHLCFLCRGHLMVDMFFILSGFVLAYAYARPFQDHHFDAADFLVKRFARIYPLHVATMAVVMLAAGLGTLVGARMDAVSMSPRSLLTNLTMTHAFGFDESLSFNRPSWSISAEWFAYLLFPWLYWIVSRLPARSAVLTAIAAFLFAESISLRAGLSLTDRTHRLGILRILFEFPIGIALCRLFLKADFRPARQLIWLSVLAVFVTMQCELPPCLTVLAIACLIYVTACSEREDQLPVLRSPWAVHGGTISYSIYMLHTPVAWVGFRPFEKMGIQDGSALADSLRLGLAGLTLVMAHYSYLWIETPGRRLIIEGFERLKLSRSRGRGSVVSPTEQPSRRDAA